MLYHRYPFNGEIANNLQKSLYLSSDYTIPGKNNTVEIRPYPYNFPRAV